MEDISQHLIDRVEAHVRRRSLTDAYWTILDHAWDYRNSSAFVTAKANWETWKLANPSKENKQLYSKYIVHSFYAKGLEEAARDIGVILGISDDQHKRDVRKNRDAPHSTIRVQVGRPA